MGTRGDLRFPFQWLFGFFCLFFFIIIFYDNSSQKVLCRPKLFLRTQWVMFCSTNGSNDLDLICSKYINQIIFFTLVGFFLKVNFNTKLEIKQTMLSCELILNFKIILFQWLFCLGCPSNGVWSKLWRYCQSLPRPSYLLRGVPWGQPGRLVRQSH